MNDLGTEIWTAFSGSLRANWREVIPQELQFLLRANGLCGFFLCHFFW